jgi:putative transposase
MHFNEAEFYHLYNRGNNKQPIFFTPENYLFFIKKIRVHLQPVCSIISYCLMPNHFHLIIQINERSVATRNSFGGKPIQELSFRIGILLSSYSQAINKQQKTSGSLFQQKTKAKLLSEQVMASRENYIEGCFFYVHNNPLEAGLVTDLKDWPYSSFLDYTGARKGTLCNKEVLFSLTGLSESDIRNRHL